MKQQSPRTRQHPKLNIKKSTTTFPRPTISDVPTMLQTTTNTNLMEN
jgi:hypothetical protein